MRSFSTLTALFVLLVFLAFSTAQSAGQNDSIVTRIAAPGDGGSGSTIALRATSTMSVASEIGGAFMSSTKCDADGNLYIRKLAMDRPLLGPVVKIDTDGKRTALFDPTAFSELGLNRADAFSPASDGGLYQIAQAFGLKTRLYVLHFSSDGSPSSSTPLDAEFEVYTFAAFANGNFLLSGVKRDLENKNDRGRNFTAVFSNDGRELAQLSFQEPQSASAAATPGAGTTAKSPGKSLKSAQAADVVKKADAEKQAPTLDLSYAEVGDDGNLYVMRRSSPALVYVVAPSGKIERTMKIASPLAGGEPTAFHVSSNQLAISFWNDKKQSQVVIVADAETGERIASYGDPTGLGPAFACYSADEGAFTFLKLGDANALEVIRAEAQ